MKIDIKGPIIGDADQWIYDWFAIPAVSPSKVNSAIEEAERNKSKQIDVFINSGGGSVFAASEIYSSLKAFPGKVAIFIVGMAASAASVVAMAGDDGDVSMAPTGQLMIHNASTIASGDYRNMDHTSEFLQNVNQSIANAYMIKTKKSADELKNMMDKETWLTSQQALEHGFIDNVMFENQPIAVADGSNELVNGILPPEVIEKVRNELARDKSLQTVNSATTIVPTTNVKEEDLTMDLEKLKNEHPELFKEVKNLGFTDGVKAENERMKAIDEMALPGNESMVEAAKYETPVTAEQLAVKMIKAQKEAGSNYLNNAKKDAQPLNQVTPSAAPETDNVTAEDKAVSALVDLWGGK
ncbi:head maturation protease, ClpP-related [Psychrobacillus sp. FSL K6-1464]|uniref:head maturation protease, ClpP-related n=1 Tax=Psychrobacillus sp. FSL K6-1464 TaxID=2921545 RepID=UPI0030FC865D